MVMGEVRILEYNNQVTHCRSFAGCQFPLCCMPQSTVATSSITCTALNIRQVIRFGPGVFINCRIVVGVSHSGSYLRGEINKVF